MKKSRISMNMASALEQLEDLADAGVKFVPSQPTSAMTSAGARAGNIGEDHAARIYRAMVEADNLNDNDLTSNDQVH